MSKKGQAALEYADPKHPKHRVPSWDRGDVARFCGVAISTVVDWSRAGHLPAEAVTGVTRRSLFSPAAVIAQTRQVRVPLAGKLRARRVA